MTTIEVDEDGDAAPHPASPGDRLVIRLAESPSSGYRWQVGEYDRPFSSWPGTSSSQRQTP